MRPLTKQWLRDVVVVMVILAAVFLAYFVSVWLSIAGSP